MCEQTELAYWLALLRAPGLNVRGFMHIVSTFSPLQDFFNLNKKQYTAIHLPPQTIAYFSKPDWRGVEQDLDWADNNPHCYIITIISQDYPTLLKEISSPPPILFIKGHKEILNHPQIAIIGSRDPSPAGKETAFRLALDLTKARVTVTSGMALGIDAAAHWGALEAGPTLAVLGTSLNLCYPKQNSALADKISEQGALVSEFYYNTGPYACNFPRRNRLISGLSLGTVVVEANLKSGSLITASYALEQGREVFAVPGSIYHLKARGCHFLIKQGATLVENAQDVMDGLPLWAPTPSFIPPQAVQQEHEILEEDHLKLLECIGYEPTKIDVLVERSHFSISKVTSILADLELTGWVCSTVGGYTRVPQ